MSSRRTYEDAAFTLIELLTLTAIVGVLAVLVVATARHSQGPAQRAQCANNLRQLGVALHEFVADNHVYPLFANVDYRHGGYPAHLENWIDALEHEKVASRPGKTFFETGVWHCPTAFRPPDFPTNAMFMSYGYNAYGLDVMGDPVSLGLGGHRIGIYPQTLAPPVKESEVAAPGDMMAIGDVFHGGVVFWRDVQMAGSGMAAARHQGGANVVFCDNHVESLKVKSLLAGTNNAVLARWNHDHLPHRERLSP